MFQKAIKREAKGRVALIGPAGAGKSFTMLTLARLLAGPQGKIAAIDTEHGSLSKYADMFEFDVCELDSFSPDNFLKSLRAAEQAGYAVFCCDSLSHFWVGKDGALEFVDMAAKRHKDNMGGWKEFRPHERAMVDAMIASPCHVICTMRTKTEYQEQVNQQTGKKQRVKIGLAPVQRDGLEYEFDLIGYMDEDNTLVVDKTRCSFYAQKAFTRPAGKEFGPFVEWLKGAPAEERQKVAAQPSPQQPQQQVELPEELQQLLAKCTSAQGVQNAMATLGDRLAAVLDSEEASTAEFNKLCAEQKVGDWQKLLNSRDKAKTFIRAFYNRIEEIIETRKPTTVEAA